jgi:RimJ/RimL family protein N-acetyltransferase
VPSGKHSALSSALGSPPPRPRIPKLDELDLVIETSRLRLRQFADTDVDELWPFVSDPELPRMMSWAAHTDRGQTLEWLRHAQAGYANSTGVTWAIELDGKIAGCVSLDGVRFVLGAWRIDRAELGYWIAPAHWNKGLMTEAAHAVVRTGFETVGLHKITVGCIAENVASRRVIEKLGFRPVGRLEDDVWRDNRWWSVLRYELTASEWSDVTTTMRVHRPVRDQ